MIREIKIPEIGENVSSGTVVNVLVSKGDRIEADQPVLEVETEKAVVEIPSPAEGTIQEILVSTGDEVEIGQVIGKLDTEGAGAEGEQEREEGPKEEPEEPGEPEEPEEAEEPEEPEEPAEGPKDAEEREQRRQPAPEKAAGERAAREKKPEAARARADGSKREEPAPEEPEEPSEVAPAAPSVRRLARELGADIHAIEGTGPGGRITADDVKAYVKAEMRATGGADEPRRPAAGKTAGTGAPGRPEDELPDFSRWGEIERQKMNRVRQTIAANTAHAWQVVPHVTQFDKADLSGVQRFLQRYAKTAERASTKLTLTAVLTKVLALGLERFPRFNASIDVGAGELILKHYVHIGLAVDTEHGLMVPVIRDADQKSILELAAEVVDLAQKARDRKLALEDFEGGTFTISNQGGIGGTQFTPVVFWPQVAILGVSRTRTEAVYEDEAFVPRPMLPLSLSYDHRIIDGADAARFLRWVAEAIEDPLLIHLERA